jgi:hypothetical protein
MVNTFACLDENDVVFDITQFDIFLDDAPIAASSYARIDGEMPTIGMKWTGEKFE